MKIIFSLDYELFLGSRTGSVSKCLVEPMSVLTSIAGKYGVRFTVFVDASYLCMLKKYSERYPGINRDMSEITSHLKLLENTGHSIQLHIHPHWFYSHFDGHNWALDTTHYKLSDLTFGEAQNVFAESYNTLCGIIGKKPVAFRAGGFSAQPTVRLTELMSGSDIRIDSSVLPGNRYDSPWQQYDYVESPRKGAYDFEKDICREEFEGRFREVPISTFRLSPLFYWKLAFNRLLKQKKHRNFGDGESVKTSSSSIRDRLTRYSWAYAAMDDYKSSCLWKAFCRTKEISDIFTVIGHPKLTTPYSARMFEKFLEKASENKDNEFITIDELL